MDIRFREIGKHKVLVVDGDIDLYNVGELKNTLIQLIEQEACESIVLDMDGTTYVDSAGIGAMVIAHKRMTSANGHFGLLHLNAKMRNIFSEAGMDEFFKIYGNEDELNS